jgi:predicted transcriptional regulator
MANNGKRAKYKLLLEVGISDETKIALEKAAEFNDSTCSQLARTAIKHFLVREGWLRHPAAIYQQQPQQAAE